MKNIFAVLIGLMLSSSAFACMWTTENCSFEVLNEASGHVQDLKQNQRFMESGKFDELANKAKYADGKMKSCSNWLCVNNAAVAYLSYVKQLKRDYPSMPVKTTAAPVAVAVQDKWAEQCVYVEKANVAKFNDGAGTQQAGVLKQYSTYMVTQVNGGKLVGLGTDGKLVGWAKKTDLLMQDLRNCN